MTLCKQKINTLTEFYKKYNATFEYQNTIEEFNSAYGLLSFIYDNLNNHGILLNCVNIPRLYYPDGNRHSLISDIRESIEHYKEYTITHDCIFNSQQILEINRLITHIENNIYYQNYINI